MIHERDQGVGKVEKVRKRKIFYPPGLLCRFCIFRICVWRERQITSFQPITRINNFKKNIQKLRNSLLTRMDGYYSCGELLTGSPPLKHFFCYFSGSFLTLWQFFSWHLLSPSLVSFSTSWSSFLSLLRGEQLLLPIQHLHNYLHHYYPKRTLCLFQHLWTIVSWRPSQIWLNFQRLPPPVPSEKWNITIFLSQFISFDPPYRSPQEEQTMEYMFDMRNQWRKLFELFLTCPEPETLGDPRDA